MASAFESQTLVLWRSLGERQQESAVKRWKWLVGRAMRRVGETARLEGVEDYSMALGSGSHGS